MNNNLYLDIHILQNVPPCCINRDDTGSPKTARYGGAVRARVSSQAWKHEMRKMFKENAGEENVGIRTKNVLKMITAEIQKLNTETSNEKVNESAKKVLEGAGIKINKQNKSDVLVFFSHAQAKALAELAIEDKDDKDYKEKCKNALNSTPSIDMALFGRMVAADPLLNFDAAAQVAHAISTHAVHNEYDYFTAVDDLTKDEESGAGHLGTVEFNSATLYRYATVNVLELFSNLHDLTADTVRNFVEAFVMSMPTGKQNTFANKTLPDYIYIALRTDTPINLVGAFETPVSSTNGYLEKSEKQLEEYSAKIYKNYASEPVMTWKLGEKNIAQILVEVEKAVSEKLSEREGE